MNEDNYNCEDDDDDNTEDDYERELERIVTIFRQTHNESTTDGIFMGTQMPPRNERWDKFTNWFLIPLMFLIAIVIAVAIFFGVPALIVRFPPSDNPITYREALRMWFDLLLLIPIW